MIYRPDRWFNFDELEAEITRNNIVWSYARDCSRNDEIPDEPISDAKQLQLDGTEPGAQRISDDIRASDTHPAIIAASPVVHIPNVMPLHTETYSTSTKGLHGLPRFAERDRIEREADVRRKEG